MLDLSESVDVYCDSSSNAESTSPGSGCSSCVSSSESGLSEVMMLWVSVESLSRSSYAMLSTVEPVSVQLSFSLLPLLQCKSEGDLIVRRLAFFPVLMQ